MRLCTRRHPASYCISLRPCTRTHLPTFCMSLRGAGQPPRDVAIRSPCSGTERKAILWANTKSTTNLPWHHVLAHADTRQISACHCEERSDVAIRFSLQWDRTRSNTLGEYARRNEFALSPTGLQRFSAGTRIATPRRPKVRHAPRRPKASGGATLPWGSSPRKGCPFAGPHALARNDMQKTETCQRVQERRTQ